MATELKRSDTLDMRRAGKVSEDERAVLRIEWRAALSGVEADRSVQEIMAKLRQMEASVVTVNQLLRSMPNEKRASPTAPPAPAASEERDTGGLDWRLMAANLTAIVLVAIWWASRRKAQKAAAALEAELTAKMRSGVHEAAEPAARIDPAVPVAPPFSATEFEISPMPPADIAGQDDNATLAPAFEAPSQAAIEEPRAVPAAAMPAVEEHAAAPTPAQTLATDAPPVIDFVLEEADPSSLAKETPRPARRAASSVTPASVSASLNKNVEPTLQLAEIMLSMGLEQGAAQALVEYTEANPRHAIYHMLKLLGIYRKRGLHREFQETAEKLRKNFNIQAEEWGASESGEPPTLEKFSRVAQHVQSIWNQPAECITYLRHLLEDNRDGARAGFPQQVAEEILLLVEILKDTSGTAQPPA